MRVLTFLFLILTASSAFAESPHVVYESHVSGADKFNFIYPILTDSAEYQGFVACDRDNRQVKVSWWRNSETLTTAISGSPQKCIVRSGNYDQLALYVLRHDNSIWSRLPLRLDLFYVSDTIEFVRTGPSIQGPYWSEGDFQNYNAMDLQFVKDHWGTTEAVTVSASARFAWIDVTIGWGEIDEIRGAEFPIELDTVILRGQMESIQRMELSVAEEESRVWYSNPYWYIDADSDVPGYSYWDGCVVGIMGPLGDTTGLWRFSDGSIDAALVGDFNRNKLGQEVILVGEFKPLTDTTQPLADLVACYNFSSGAPQLIWSVPNAGWPWQFVRADNGSIIGTKSDATATTVYFMKTVNGHLGQTIELDRHLDAITIFETGTNPKFLNLIGHTGDSVFVYQFDLATDVNGDDAQALPTSFTLSNCYPNPFNPSTSFTLSLPHSGEAKVSVFNLLGQEVEVIHDGPLSDGTHTLTWRGAKASGIYLLRAEFDGSQQTRKMVLVK